MKRILFSLMAILVSLAFGESASADVFSFHFTFNSTNSRLDFDTRNSSVVTIDATKTIPSIGYEQIYETGDFEASFLDVKGYEFDRKRFDVQDGNFTVDFPRYTIAKTVQIYRKDDSTPILVYDLSSFILCNGNDVCEYNKGENLQTCLADCSGDNIRFDAETEKTLQQNKGVIIDPKTGETILRDMRSVQVETSSNNGVQPTETPPSGNSTVQKTLMVIALVAIVLGVIFMTRWFLRRHR